MYDSWEIIHQKLKGHKDEVNFCNHMGENTKDASKFYNTWRPGPNDKYENIINSINYV